MDDIMDKFIDNYFREPVICGLIRGRHAVPDHVSFFVFDSDIPQDRICDAFYMEEICTRFLDLHGPSAVEVYVTGFTPALLALIKCCRERGIGLSAYNYDREGRKFWRQEVL